MRYYTRVGKRQGVYHPKAFTGNQYGTGAYKNFLKAGRKIGRSSFVRKMKKTLANPDVRYVAWDLYKKNIAPIVKARVAATIGEEWTEALEKDAKAIQKKGVHKYINEDVMPEVNKSIDYATETGQMLLERGAKDAGDALKAKTDSLKTKAQKKADSLDKSKAEKATKKMGESMKGAGWS